jgi:hypothetical protein
MSDLGPQLEREGAKVELAPGALGRFDARLRRRQQVRKVGVSIVAVVVAVVGIGFAVKTFGGDAPAVPATPAPSPSARNSDVLPPGTYWTSPITRPQLVATLRARGFGAGDVDRFFVFEDLGTFSRTVRFGIRVERGGLWTQFQQRDQRSVEVGWSGAYRATAPGELAALGYGCTITYGIHRSEGQVGITVLDEQGPPMPATCGHRDLVAQTAIYQSAPFERSPGG